MKTSHLFKPKLRNPIAMYWYVYLFGVVNVSHILPDCILLFYILTTSEVISWCVPTCCSMCSWWLYNAAPLGDQSTAPWPDISHISPDTEPTSPCRILIMMSAWLESDKYQFVSHWLDSTSVRTHDVWITWSPKTWDRRSLHSAISSGQHKPSEHDIVIGSLELNVGWSGYLPYLSSLSPLLPSPNPTRHLLKPDQSHLSDPRDLHQPASSPPKAQLCSLHWSLPHAWLQVISHPPTHPAFITCSNQSWVM